jgi:LuxR family maltose regulon positive regulatory protein
MVVPLRRWAAGALAVVGDRPLPLRAMATIALGWGALWQGQPRAAEEYLAQADAEARWIGNEVISRNHGSGLHAVLALLRGDRDRAVQIARERIDSLPAGYGEWGRWHGLYFSARVAAACGAAAVLQEWLRELQALAPRLVEVSAARLRPVAGLAGTLAALEGRFDAARSHWAEVLAHEGNADLLGQAGEVRIRQALLDARSGALDAAATLLRPLLGTPDDGPRGAIYAVPEVVELARTEWSGRLDGARLATLQAWAATLAPATIAVVTAPLDGNAERSPERLTGREVEVVALIARGVSNKLIARELDLSPHTVKRHVANTLAKLGVASRGEAAAWYHAQRGRVHDA